MVRSLYPTSINYWICAVLGKVCFWVRCLQLRQILEEWTDSWRWYDDSRQYFPCPLHLIFFQHSIFFPITALSTIKCFIFLLYLSVYFLCLLIISSTRTIVMWQFSSCWILSVLCTWSALSTVFCPIVFNNIRTRKKCLLQIGVK